MVIKKLKHNMTVYDVRKTTGLSRFSGNWNTWTVHIKDIDLENNKVFASWNGNSPEWYTERTWKKWRLSKPN